MKLAVSLLARVADRIRRSGMIESGDRVLVACSGGPDSTVLLDILRRLAPQFDCSLGALYLDHQQHALSGRARRMVRDRCRRWQLPFFTAEVDSARCPPGSGESELRAERYRVFTLLSKEKNFSKVATGHTASDQVETVLMRIFRGTGVAGLAGIPMLRDGLFIRPLIELDAETIRAYLCARRLAWVEDPTNGDRRMLRNRLRLDLLPLVRRTINPGVDRALLRLASSAERDNAALQALADRVSIAQPEPCLTSVDLDLVQSLPAAVQARLVLRMARRLGGSGTNLEQAHMERLLVRLLPGDSRRWRLGLQGGLEARAERGRLYLAKDTPEAQVDVGAFCCRTRRAQRANRVGEGELAARDG